MQKKIKITRSQKEKFDKLILQSKFDRLAYALISEPSTSAEEKSKKILKLKQKMFGK